MAMRVVLQFPVPFTQNTCPSSLVLFASFASSRALCRPVILDLGQTGCYADTTISKYVKVELSVPLLLFHRHCGTQE